MTLDVMLRTHDIERLVLSLIRTEQDRLIREGRLPSACHLDAQLGAPGGVEVSDLSIDEDRLGFDSLSRLHLVSVFNLYFDLSATGIEDYLLVHRGLPDWVALIEQHLQMMGKDATITFSSSGSTGPQSHSTHKYTALQNEAAAHLAGPLSRMGPDNRVLASVPVHHIYGFIWTLLVPQALGCPVRDLPPGLPGPVLRNAASDDIVVSTPFGWEQMAQAGQRLPDGVTGISSGAPTTAATWEAAATLKLSTLFEIYGSSETAGLGWRRAPNDPLRLCADLVKAPEGLYRACMPGPLDVQDTLDWQDETLFHVKGRKDKMVQVGGVNVSLEKVRAHLLGHSYVQDAAVRLDGHRLKAFVVHDPAMTDLVDLVDLESALRAHVNLLPAPARPDRFEFGQTLPRSATGKLCDW